MLFQNCPSEDLNYLALCFKKATQAIETSHIFHYAFMSILSVFRIPPVGGSSLQQCPIYTLQLQGQVNCYGYCSEPPKTGWALDPYNSYKSPRSLLLWAVQALHVYQTISRN